MERYEVIGRYMNGSEVTHYHVRVEGNGERKLTREQLCYLVGKGKVVNCEASLGTHDIQLKGTNGTKLDSLPKVTLGENGVITYETKVYAVDELAKQVSDGLKYLRREAYIRRNHTNGVAKTYLELHAKNGAKITVVIGSDESRIYIFARKEKGPIVEDAVPISWLKLSSNKSRLYREITRLSKSTVQNLHQALIIAESKNR